MSLGGYLPPVICTVLGETSSFTAAMGKVKTEMTGLQAAVTKMSAVGKVAFAALGTAALAAGYEAVKFAMGFDQQMELIHTQAGASQAEVEQLKDKVLALAPAVGIGPEKLAEGLYHIESTGYRGAQAMDILTASAKLAALGLADLDTVTFAMSGVMSVGMKDIKSAADATNYLNTIVGMGDMKMGSLAAAIGTGVLPSFKSAGLGMTDFGAALATITDNSTPADEAATRLRMTISLMSAPSGKAAAALESIGLKSTQLADDMRKPDGLLVAVMDLKEHLEKSGKTLSEQNEIVEHAFGGGKTSGAILTLLEETDRLKAKYTAIGTEASRAKAAQDAWAQQQKQFSQQVHEVVAQLEAWAVKLGQKLIPKIREFIKWIKEHKELVKDIAYGIGTVLVLAMAKFTTSLLASAAAWAISPFGLITIAVLALVAGIKILSDHWSELWRHIKNAAHDAWQWLDDNVWKPIENKFHSLKQGWDKFWTDIGKKLTDVYNTYIAPVINAVISGWNWIDENIFGNKPVHGNLGGAAGAFLQMTNNNSPGANTFKGKKIPGYAMGGTVPGPIGMPQLAVVHGGETVTPAGASRGGGDLVLHARFVMPDGRHMRTEVLRYARTSGQGPSNMFANTPAVSYVRAI